MVVSSVERSPPISIRVVRLEISQLYGSENFITWLFYCFLTFQLENNDVFSVTQAWEGWGGGWGEVSGGVLRISGDGDDRSEAKIKT